MLLTLHQTTLLIVSVEKVKIFFSQSLIFELIENKKKGYYYVNFSTLIYNSVVNNYYYKTLQ